MHAQTPIDRVDEKGKVFTERVRKASVQVRIVTVRGRISGRIYVKHHERVKDVLNNKDEQFIAVTDAEIEYINEPQRQHADFIALNKDHILTVVPLDESTPAFDEEEYYMP